MSTIFEEETYSRRAYNWLREKWYITPIVSAIPGIVFSILGISKDVEWFSFLYNEKEFLKTGYIILFFTISFVCGGVSGVWHWLNHKEEKSNDKLRDVYKEAKNMVKKYHSKCHKNFSDIIYQKKYEHSVLAALNAINDPASRLNPITKIKSILDFANTLLSFVFGIEEEKISIVLAYKENPDEEWIVLEKRNIVYEAEEISDLFDDCSSAFANAIKQRTWPVFYLRKEDAVMNNKYTASKYEIVNGLKGSIYCRDLSIYKNKKMKKGFVLAISTMEKRFGKNNTYSENICTEIFELIEDMLRPEFDHMYMNDYFNLGGYINEQTNKKEVASVS